MMGSTALRALYPDIEGIARPSRKSRGAAANIQARDHEFTSCMTLELLNRIRTSVTLRERFGSIERRLQVLMGRRDVQLPLQQSMVGTMDRSGQTPSFSSLNYAYFEQCVRRLDAGQYVRSDDVGCLAATDGRTSAYRRRGIGGQNHG
jgi:hypothetical protein